MTKRMTDEWNEEDLVSYEISDDALENITSAPMGLAANYTLYYCTYLDLCPGP
jgi:hypothetical protein